MQFIAAASNQGYDAISHGLRTPQSRIQIVKTKHPKDGHSVVFVDTPGFDATSKSDAETLTHIADWLVKT
jgi:GTPase Era involved in 16S rRNA processing